MNRLLRVSGLSLAVLTLILAAGCGGDPGSLSSETDDSAYREGQQLERQGRADEALAAYLKVIARRGDAAPESHLDAGILYLNHIKDPIAAIYHFRKYLELMPNSRQAANVKGQIAAATREFARTLPGQPMDSQAARLGLGDEIESLRRENDELRAELAALRDGVTMAPAAHLAAAGTFSAASPGSPGVDGRVSLPARGAPAGSAAGAAGALSVALSENEEPAGGGALAAPLPAPASASASGLAAPAGWARVGGAGGGETTSPLPLASGPARVSAASAAASVGGGAAVGARGSAGSTGARAAAPGASRRHTVVKGDTLSSLAQKYYGNRSKWRDILAANHDLLSGPNDLKIGMELRVP
jgi:nucleoid-associated protein YgaU